MRICDRWIQEGKTDRRGRSNPPQCTTSREDRTTDFSAANGAMKEGCGRQNGMKLSLLTSHAPSLETPWRDDAEQLRYAPPHWSCIGYYGMGRYWISLSHSSSTHCRYFKQPVLHLRGVGASCTSLPSGLGHSHISTG
ncbi:uncharacterized protein TNCV_795501 [Trichonephila clavipes]|nr:uncharacterized protein TNCV_795501 [Trichonephila clavipes]